MDNYFSDVYLKRLNRYGLNFQQRLQNQREEAFERQLLKSIYYIKFDYDGHECDGEFLKYKQDETQTLHYLLTRTSLNIPNGTVLEIPDKDYEPKPWMVYYLEYIVASGYNKYIMLRMTHNITWTDNDGNEQSSWAYMYGQEDNMLKDEIRSRSRMDTIYSENLKLNFFIMPVNENIRKDNYLEVGEGKLKEAYVVTGYDIQSSEGVEYVSVDPVPLRENAPVERTPNDTEDNTFWIKGEIKDGC